MEYTAPATVNGPRPDKHARYGRDIGNGREQPYPTFVKLYPCPFRISGSQIPMPYEPRTNPN